MSRPPPIVDKEISKIGHSVPMVGFANQIFIAVSISMKAMIILREYEICFDCASVLFVFKHTH